MLFPSLFRSRTSRVSRRNRSANPVVAPLLPVSSSLEPLEARRLLAADPGGVAALSSGVLQVTGTRKADEIHVDLNATTNQLDVTINGAAAGSFNPADATGGIRIDAGGGN